MSHNVLLPIIFGLVAIVLVIGIILYMPFNQLQIIKVDASPMDQGDVNNQNAQDESNAGDRPRIFQTIINQNREIFKVLRLSPTIFFLICTFFVTSAFGQLMAGSVFLQYVEKQLGIDMAEVRVFGY